MSAQSNVTAINASIPLTIISEQTFYRWKQQFAGLGLSEVRELRSLRHENARLKQLVADLTLDRHILQEIVRKKI